MSSRRRWKDSTLVVTAIACFCGQSAMANAQQAGKIVGARLRTPQPFNYVRIPETQKAAVTATMQKLYDIVRRDTMFYEPVSFDVQPSPRIDLPPRTPWTSRRWRH